MKKLECSSVVSSECEFAFIGGTDAEVLEKAKQHALEKHPQRAAGLTDEKLKTAIKEVATDGAHA